MNKKWCCKLWKQAMWTMNDNFQGWKKRRKSANKAIFYGGEISFLDLFLTFDRDRELCSSCHTELSKWIEAYSKNTNPKGITIEKIKNRIGKRYKTIGTMYIDPSVGKLLAKSGATTRW